MRVRRRALCPEKYKKCNNREAIPLHPVICTVFLSALYLIMHAPPYWSMLCIFCTLVYIVISYQGHKSRTMCVYYYSNIKALLAPWSLGAKGSWTITGFKYLWKGKILSPAKKRRSGLEDVFDICLGPPPIGIPQGCAARLPRRAVDWHVDTFWKTSVTHYVSHSWSLLCIHTLQM